VTVAQQPVIAIQRVWHRVNRHAPAIYNPKIEPRQLARPQNVIDESPLGLPHGATAAWNKSSLDEAEPASA
jgi:hypothetical protein